MPYLFINLADLVPRGVHAPDSPIKAFSPSRVHQTFLYRIASLNDCIQAEHQMRERGGRGTANIFLLISIIIFKNDTYEDFKMH